jgi:flagellar protein FlaG
MVDPISNAAVTREMGMAQSRPQDSPASPAAADPGTNLPVDQRLSALQAVMEKLVKKGLPGNSKLLISQDKETGTFIYRSVDPETGNVITQWPPEQLIKLRDYIKEMEGMLVDTTV